MVKNRQPYAEEFEADDEWKTAEKFNLLGICPRTLGGKSVRDKMLDQKQPNRDDASKRMQPAQKERMPLTSPQWGYTLFDANRSGTAGSRCHKVPCEFRDGERTFYYVGAREGKSRKASAPGCRADQVWSLQDLVGVWQQARLSLDFLNISRSGN